MGLPRACLDDASGRLFELGATGLQEDWLPGTAPPPPQPWDTHEPAEPDPLVLTAWFEHADRARIDQVLGDLPAELRWSGLPDQDWEALGREGFGPIRVSDRLTIAPPWDAPAGALVIEPGQGFGTGHHPTTRQVLHAMEALLASDGEGIFHTVLDIGTGSGILALAAARHGLVVHGIDVDAEGIRHAQRHAELNQLPARLDTTPLARVPEPSDLVLANLHAELLVALAPDIARVTRRSLITAGVLMAKEPAVSAALEPHFERVSRHCDGPWVCTRFVPR